MSNWRVTLKGDAFDLESLAEISPAQGGDWSVAQEGGAFCLRSNRFEHLTEAAEIRQRAEAIVALLNGVAKVRWGEFDPIEVGGVVGEGQDGGIQIFATDTIRVRDRVRGKVSDPSTGKPVNASRSSSLDSWVAIGEQNPRVREALRVFIGSPSWDGLYKVWEVIEEDVGGRITKHGWASQPQVSRFTQTAASERHAKQKIKPPPNPMSLPEAEQFIRSLLEEWLNSKRS